MKLRRATFKDAKNLFSWRNDPEARANFRNPNAVTWEEHLDWMKRAVDPGNPDNYCVIAEDKIGPIGVIRVMGRNDPLGGEIAINIAPERRGEGHGGRLLAKICEQLPGYLVAEIKNTNMPSRKIFERCGFEWISEHNGYILYRRPKRDE